MRPKMESSTGSLAVIGVDIGKEGFHLIGFDVDGKIAFPRKIRRLSLKDAFEKLRSCTVGTAMLATVSEVNSLCACRASRLTNAVTTTNTAKAIPTSMKTPELTQGELL